MEEPRVPLESGMQVLYFFFWLFSLFVGMNQMSEVHDFYRLIGPLLLCTYAMAWFCDYMLILTLASWRSVRILAPPVSHTWQFSLGVMLAVVLALGGWVSGLVLYFREI